MTQEQKELLLKDLCSRLPYGVKVEINYGDAKYAPSTPSKIDVANKKLVFNFDIPIQDCKPYLRPMSSMTEEEAKEMCKTVCSYDKITSLQIISDRVRYGILHNGSFNHVTLFFNKIYSLKQLDWLNAHHFDYRGLIPMGLAIEVIEKNNPYKN